MEEGLKVSLILDPGDSAKSTDNVTASIASLGKTAEQADSAMNGLAKSIDTDTNALNKLSAQAKAVSPGMSNLQKGVKGASASLNELKTAAPSASSALINISRVAQDAPFGFIAIQNNIPPLIDSFQSLVKSTGSVTAALKTIGSGLIGFGGIGVAVSLATTALTVFSMASRKTKDDSDKLAEAQKSVADVMRETTSSVQGEVATTQALSAIVLDSTKSYEARNAALNQLKKTGGDYYKSLTLEKSSYDELKTASDRYTNSIIRAAAVKGLQDQISSLAGELAKSAPIINKGFASLVAKNPNDPFKAFADSVANGAKGVAVNFKYADSLLAVGARKVSTDISAASDNITRTTEDKFGKMQELQTRLKGFVDQLATVLSGTDTPDTPKAAKSVITVTDVLADLDKQLLKTNALFVNSGDTLKTLTNDQIKNYQNALAGLIDIGVLPGDKIFDQLKGRLDDLQKIGTPIKVTIPLNPDFTIPPAVSNSIFTKDLLNTHFRPQVNKFTADLNSLIQTSIEGGISSVSDAIGNALVSGDIGGIFSAFINSIATFMQKLGASLVATGIGIEAFKASLESLQGATAIIAGIGLIAAAGAFKAIAAGGSNSFATGGTVYGPQLIAAGDNPERKEHILSDNQLQKIAGSAGGAGLIGEFILRGPDLELAVSRAVRNLNRIN